MNISIQLYYNWLLIQNYCAMCNWALTIFGFSLKVLTCSLDIVREHNNFNWEPLPVKMGIKVIWPNCGNYFRRPSENFILCIYSPSGLNFRGLHGLSWWKCAVLHKLGPLLLIERYFEFHKNVNWLELLNYIFENNSPKGSFWGNKRKLEFSDLSSRNLLIFWQFLLIFFPRASAIFEISVPAFD